MSSPGTLRFGQVANRPSPPPSGYDLIYVKTDDVLYIQDSSGVEVALGSASAITSLTGDVTGSGPGSAATTVNFVGGASAASIAAAATAIGTATPFNIPNTVVERDSSGNFAAGIITASLNGNANTATTSISFTGSLLGDVTGTQGATVVSFVGGSSAANVHSAELAANAATALNTASTIVKRDASGNFAANVITASLTGNVTGNLVGNVTGNVSGSAASFTGNLAGDVTGTQGATVVGAIQGTTVNPTAPTDAQFLVYQTGITSYKAVSMSGAATMSDTGVVTLINTSVTGQLLTGYATGSNTPITATNSILTAFENLQAQIVATVGAAITSLTGDVTATGPGAATATVVAIQRHAVSSTAPTDAQILIWNSGTSSWTPKSMSGDVHITDLGVTSIVATTNSTITTLPALSLPGSQVTGNIPGNAANITATTNSTLTTLTALSLPTTQLTGTLQAAQFPALTGDVTTTAGSLVTHLVATTNSTLTTLSALSLPTTQLTGTLQAAQEPAHTGDVTNTAGSLVLSLVATTNSTLTTLTALSLPTTQLTGTLQAAQFPALTGDVTTTAGSLVTHLIATTNSTLTTLSALSLPGSQVTGNIAGNAANVTGVVAIVNGGTGQTTANAGFDALSPMTTLGDIIYENATPTAARLPGNTTTAREFLTSQGTGTLANAPSWSSLVSGDIPNNAANTSGTAANITATTNSTLTTLTALALPTTQLTGTLQAAQFPALTGDVTTTAGSLTTHLVATTNSTLVTLSALSLPGSQVTGDIAGNAANVNGVVGILHGGTGQTTANAAFNALSPMTTLGDIIYENATPAAARLPGNTTATREFLTSQGTGTLANAPTWSGLVSGDIPNNAANTSGTAANITATTNSTLTSLPSLTSATSLAILGSQVGGFTQGSVIFAGPGGTLTQDNANFYWDDTAHALGIGVIPAATAVLDVVNNSGSTKAIQVTGYGSNVGFRGREAGGTAGSPTATVSGTIVTFFSGRGYGTTGFAAASTGAINIVADATFTDTSMPTHIGFNVTPVGSVTSAEAMRIANTGHVLIGTTTDGSQLLQVNGSALFAGVVTDSVAPIMSSLTGYMYANGSSQVTASTTIPTTVLTGTISAAQMLPLPTNDIYVGNGSNQPAAVAMSGDVNIVASGATTIQPNVVTNAKLAQMPANTLKGNNTGVTANAADLTVAQVNTMLGTVTSVTASSPLQSSGGATPNISFINQSANTILAGPTSGGTAAPTFRALVSADILPINLASTANGGVTGILPIANGGTNSGTTLNNNRIMVSSGGAIVEAAALTNGQMLIGSTGAAPVAATLTAGTGISIANAAGSITITSTGTTPLATKTANYTILSTDGTILCDTSGGAFTLTLPNPSGLSGQIWRVIDSTGNFQTNNLTLAPHSTEKIEGLAASKVLQTPWGWFNVTTDGVSWYIG